MSMKSHWLLTLSLGVVATLPAQTMFSDPLSAANSNWINSPTNQGGGALVFFSQGGASGLGYAVATPTAADTGYRTLANFAAPATSNWSAQVDVHLAALSGLFPGQFANLNLVVAKASDGANSNTSFALDRYNSGAGVVQDVDTYVTIGGVQAHLAEVLNATTLATLQISYDAAASQLTYGFDSDGPANGFSFAIAHTANISGWAMGPTDTFAFLLVGGSGVMTGGVGPSLAVTDAYFENFAVNSLAVPEAGTWGLFALGAIALFALRRRRA